MQYGAENVRLTSGAIRRISLAIDCPVDASSPAAEVVKTYPLMSGYARCAAARFRCGFSNVIPRDRTGSRVEPEDLLPFICRPRILHLANPNNPAAVYVTQGLLAEVIKAREEAGAHVIIDEACDVPLHFHQTNYAWAESPSDIEIQSLSRSCPSGGVQIGFTDAGSDWIQRSSQGFAFSDGNVPAAPNYSILNNLGNPKLVRHI